MFGSFLLEHCISFTIQQRIVGVLHSIEFKGRMVLKAQENGCVYTLAFSALLGSFATRTSEAFGTMKRKDVSFLFFSLHISLGKLWSHFLIHWIGDNLLLLLTSLGPKMIFLFILYPSRRPPTYMFMLHGVN